MSNLLISVIVPVYNIAPYIERCVNSILAQTYDNIEIILVDDGSKDDSPKLCDALGQADSRVKVIHKPNGGVTSARMAGIEAAKGEWTGFVDGDDEIEPDMYERLLDNALKYDADISHCGHVVIKPDGTKQYMYNTGRLAKQSNIEAVKDLLAGVFEPGLGNKLYKSSLMRELMQSGKMNGGIRINEDLLMNFYLFRKAENTVFEDFCPYSYIKREGSASQKRDIKWINDLLEVREILVKECIGSELDSAARSARLGMYMIVYNTLLNESDKEYTEKRKCVFERIKSYSTDSKYMPHDRAKHVKLLMFSPFFYNTIRKIYSRLK